MSSPRPGEALIAGIAATAGEFLGRPVQFKRVTHRPDLITYVVGRTFWTVEVESDTGGSPSTFSLLVKCSPRGQADSVDRNRDIDRYLSNRGLPVPDFVGIVHSKEVTAALWQFQPGELKATFDDYSYTEVESLVSAIVLIETTTTDVADRIGLPRKQLPYTYPISDRLNDTVVQDQSLKELQPELTFLARTERKAIRSLISCRPQVLCHNDIWAPNIILADSGVWITDWERASMGPPGANLRRFSDDEARWERLAASLYVRHMANRGWDVEIENVLFRMRAQHVFWLLSSGLGLNDRARIVSGLRQVEPVFRDLK